MPPPTRTRATKNLKENVDAVKKNKPNSDGKIAKPPRKALADKTNSLSDDNTSIDIPIKTSRVALKNKAPKLISEDGERPRRDRRLPKRFAEIKVLNKESPEKSQVSITAISPTKPPAKGDKKKQPTSVQEPITSRTRRNCRLQSVKEPQIQPKTPTKECSSLPSPFKTPIQILDSSLIANRPKRISRLPSKFEDHSISPNKFIPVVPFHASTPIVKKKTKSLTNNTNKGVTDSNKLKRQTRKDLKENDLIATKGIDQYFTKSQTTNTNFSKRSTSKDKISPDTNNNPKGKKTQLKHAISTKSPKKLPSPKNRNKTEFAKRLLEKSLSFRVFEDRKSQDNNKDVYEFTFDPNEEPPPKKKRKKVVKRKPPKPKTVILINNYDKNVQKAMDTLKGKVKPSQTQHTQAPKTHTLKEPEVIHPQNKQAAKTQTEIALTLNKTAGGKIQIIEDVIIKPADSKSTTAPVNESAKSIHMSNYASICVEDIAADFDMTDNKNYSPVNSPYPKTPQDGIESPIYEGNDDSYITVNYRDPLNLLGNKDPINLQRSDNPVSLGSNKDPLNLQGESFFEDQPVASSSMNVSVQHPLASPWRVEFNDLPIKWQANTYVKANMTPAVESSFINAEDCSKKKHVYTNLVAEEPLPTIEGPNLKQTSIMSFMKEVAERSLKKKRGRSLSPTKANSLFDDSNSNFGYKTPKKVKTDNVLATPNASNSSNDKSCEKDLSNDHIPEEISNENHENSNQDKTPKKQKKNKDGTFFGFDESKSYDQENKSPIKKNPRHQGKGLRPRSRAVLKEINTLNGPTRAVLPITKIPSLDAVEKLYEQLKSADNAPTTVGKNVTDESAVANDESSLSDEGQSMHLFEDIEVVHHKKPQRKSYGKAKKVTFLQQSNSDSDTQNQVAERSSDEEDLDDLSFHLPNVKERKVHKKKKPKKQLSKKEEKEVEEWAAGFNSMCEDIDEFPLVVE